MCRDQVAANKASFERLTEVVNTGDVELIGKTIDEVFEADVQIATPLPVEATGAEALKQVWRLLLRAFPDLHVTVEDLVGEGDKLVARNTVTGTQRGEYMGRPPTGRSVTYGEIFVLRFANGRIAETSGIVDVVAQLRQLGLLPSGAS